MIKKSVMRGVFITEKEIDDFGDLIETFNEAPMNVKVLGVHTALVSFFLSLKNRIIDYGPE